MHIVETNQPQVARTIADRLTELLTQGPVTWFVSGGSNIATQVASIRRIDTRLLSGLHVLLIDERYGNVGHSDSNWQALQEAGFFIDGPQYTAAFTQKETSLDSAVDRYETVIDSIFETSSYKFAQLGLGADGHIAGILPGSLATTSTAYVCGYQAEIFERLTLTFDALKKMDEVALVAFGADKAPQLERLSDSISPTVQPLQIIKDIAQVNIYTNNSRLNILEGATK